MVTEPDPLFGDLFSYRNWQQEKGIPVYKGYYIRDLNELDLGPWERRGGFGAFVNLEGTGGSNDAYVCEIPPGQSLTPQRHMFEAELTEADVELRMPAVARR